MAEAPLTRREFAKHVAIGTATTLAAEAALASNAPKPGRKDKAEEKEQAERDTDSPQVDARLKIIQQQYPDTRLTADILEHIRHDIHADVERSKVLSRFPLTNGDEPAFRFAAYRSDGVH